MTKKRFQDILEDADAMFGEPIAVTMDRFNRPIKAIPTGALSLDLAMGVGGVPTGRFTELFGPESTGKTTLALSIARQGAMRGIGFMYLDVENSLSLPYVKEFLGEHFDEDRDRFFQPRTQEQAFELALAGAESKKFGLIILDSVAALAPDKEFEGEFGDANVALQSRGTSKFLRLGTYRVKENGIAFVFTNQIRDKIDRYGGTTQPGGHALRHYSSVMIYLKKGDDIKSGQDITGTHVNFTIRKNKVASPFKQATTNIIFGRGIDYEVDVISFAKMLGVVQSRGSYFSFDGKTIGNKPGLMNTAECLRNDKLVLDKIVERCYNITGIEPTLATGEDYGEESEGRENL